MVLSRTSFSPRRRSAFAIGKLARACVEAGARLVERVLERPPVDGEQEVALLHDLAVVEMDAGRDTRIPAHAPPPHRPRQSGRHIRPDRRCCAGPAGPPSPPAAAARRPTAAGRRSPPAGAAVADTETPGTECERFAIALHHGGGSGRPPTYPSYSGQIPPSRHRSSVNGLPADMGCISCVAPPDPVDRPHQQRLPAAADSRLHQQNQAFAGVC